MIALDLLFGREGHAVVAQVVEAELRSGTVGDIATVGGRAFVARHLVLDAADREAEPAVEMTHPLRVAASEVIVDGDQLTVLAGQGVEVEGQGGDEGLAFTGRHLSDLVLVEGDAADELDVEMHHLPGQLMVAHDGGGAAEAAGGVLDDGESLREEGVEGFAFSVALLELLGLGAELVIRQFLVLGLEGVDPLDEGRALSEEFPVVAAREELENAEKHGSGSER